MSPPTQAVFLSYASQDAEAARCICESLRAAGVEVWFDRSELRGGDAWDARIRRQIKECALFVPVISANTQARLEGYFRIEWKLAAQRTHAMAEEKAFLLPVVIDDTAEAMASVPSEFKEVQWTGFGSAESFGAFCERVQTLLGVGPAPPATLGAKIGQVLDLTQRQMKPTGSPRRLRLAGAGVVVALAGVIFWFNRPTPAPSEHAQRVRITPTPAAQPPLDFANAKSIAVLPFANLSPDPENAFFADGVHEDVITNLAKIRDLKVISRTSTLAYRDTAQRRLRQIAEELGVAAVLEGSVRRAGNKVRVTAQLIDARTDQHLWAETYDRDLSDIFAVQAALAQEIAGALKVRLTASERALLARTMTTSTEAYDLYLRAEILRQTMKPFSTRAQWEQVVELYQRALAQDPAFAMAHVQLAGVHGIFYRFSHLDSSPARAVLARVATEAVERIAPGSAEAYYARGLFAYFVENNWERSLVALRRAEIGLPNDFRLMFTLALANSRLGRWQEQRAYYERAFTLDPKNLEAAQQYAHALFCGRHYPTIVETARRRGVMESWIPRAQFAVDGNRPAFRQRVAARLSDRDAERFRAYAAAVDARDLPVAFSVIADADAGRMLKAVDPRPLLLAAIPNAAVPPLTRAQISWLRGDAIMARQFADEAIPLCDGARGDPRGTAEAFRGVALAEAFAGRPSAALNAIEQSIASTNEAADLDLARECLGKVNVILGRFEEALVTLGQMMTSRCYVSPNEIRADPVWSRLKADRRFEEILQSARPL